MAESMSLLIIPNKVRFSNTIQKYLNKNITFIQYRYDIGYEGILTMIEKALSGRKLKNLALVLYSTPFSMCICSNESKIQCFNHEFLCQSLQQQRFFQSLSKHFSAGNISDGGDYGDHGEMVGDTRENRLDVLSCSLMGNDEAKLCLEELKKLCAGIKCSLFRDLWGCEMISDEEAILNRSVKEIYFSEINLNLITINQTINSFEKIRSVGKGAFGTAVLYRKKDDDSLVILKEINMHDLNATERQLALNEVKVLSLLDHPNIIAYFDSFEEDGILLIEMEYADNGTLQKFLSTCEEPLTETQILELFKQIVAAIHYIHEHKILHRDLKTANIFLTKEQIIKVGDFGISKVLSTTKDNAQSVIGTPYYLSPEMCQGKVYNEKSDVWSLGCILYEMVCLHKTFDGTNPLVLVNKILRGQFEPVKGNYSDELKELIHSMLQKNPADRPSTEDILYQKLPKMIRKFQSKKIDDNEGSKKQIRSILYKMNLQTLNLQPIKLPTLIRIKQVCSGDSHVVVLTTEHTVFSWGNNEYGQLGHGDLTSRVNPELVPDLTRKSLTRIGCGNGFSIFGSENGIIMTCGSGLNGCLGHGDFKDVLKPKLIESLLSVDIVSLSATHSHVLAVCSEGQVYGWGSNSHGQLGLGPSGVTQHPSPQKINIREPVFIRNAYTALDASILVTDAGAMLASGANTDNKLGLNARQGFLQVMKSNQSFSEPVSTTAGSSIPQKVDVDRVFEFMNVRALCKHRVSNVFMGLNHTLVSCDSGRIIGFGDNKRCQLGTGSNQHVPMTAELKMLKRYRINKLACGSQFSVASYSGGVLFWGRRSVMQSELDNGDVLQGNSHSKSNLSGFDADVDKPEKKNKSSGTSPSSLPKYEDDNYFSPPSKTYPTPIFILKLKTSAASDKDPQQQQSGVAGESDGQGHQSARGGNTEFLNLCDCIIYRNPEGHQVSEDTPNNDSPGKWESWSGNSPPPALLMALPSWQQKKMGGDEGVNLLEQTLLLHVETTAPPPVRQKKRRKASNTNQSNRPKKIAHSKSLSTANLHEPPIPSNLLQLSNSSQSSTNNANSPTSKNKYDTKFPKLIQTNDNKEESPIERISTFPQIQSCEQESLGDSDTMPTWIRNELFAAAKEDSDVSNDSALNTKLINPNFVRGVNVNAKLNNESVEKATTKLVTFNESDRRKSQLNITEDRSRQKEINSIPQIRIYSSCNNHDRPRKAISTAESKPMLSRENSSSPNELSSGRKISSCSVQSSPILFKAKKSPTSTKADLGRLTSLEDRLESLQIQVTNQNLLLHEKNLLIEHLQAEILKLRKEQNLTHHSNQNSTQSAVCIMQ